MDSLLGEGGMGAVYAATHVHLGKSFAIKVLSEMVAENKVAVERLLQEAQAASSIDHDNIIDVVSFDSTENGQVFIVMEMLKGKSLGDVMESGALTVEKALPLAFQVCDALHAAHEAGIVHRDLKPENVFVTQKYRMDFVKVLDFGISKVRRAEHDKVRMTQTGQLIGTPLYMSPEQSRGEDTIDRRTDVYSFGVMLYEMLAGEPPFSGGNAFQLLWKHGNETPKHLSEAAPQVPKALADVVMHTLEKEPSARPQTMAELMDALSQATGLEARNSMPSFDSLAPARVDSSGAVATLSVPQKESKGWVWAALGALVLIGGFFVFQALSGGEGEFAEHDETAEPGMLAAGEEETAEPGENEVDEGIEAAANETGDIEPAGENAPSLIAVEVSAEPAGAVIYAGDERLGQGVVTFEAQPGTDVVFRASLSGYRSAQQMVTIVEDTTIELRLRRRRAPTGSAIRGML